MTPVTAETPSIPLNPLLESPDRSFDDAVDALYKALYAGSKGLQKAVTRRHLRVILLNIVELLRKTPMGCLRYSRDRNYWTDHNKRLSNPYALSYKITQIADDLLNAGLIDHWTGEIDGYDRYQSRMRPTDAFVTQYITPFKLLSSPIETHKGSPLVFIRGKKFDKDGNKMSATETRWDATKTKHLGKKRLKEIIKGLEAYNRLLSKAAITLHDSVDPSGYSLHNRRVYRSFVSYALSTAPYSGRFYGGWWMNIRSAHRPHILIDGKATVELDYKAQHPHMLYAMNGLVLNDALGTDDPYSIPKADGSGDYYRGLAKDVFMICMNSSGKGNIRGTLLNGTPERNFEDGYRYALKNTTDTAKLMDIRQKMDIVDDPKAFKAFMTAFESFHSHVKDSFYDNSWATFQSFDADIAEYVINTMTAKKIPVLSIHDSFIVSIDHADTLEGVMKDAYRAHPYPDLKKALPPIIRKSLEQP